MHFNKPVLDIQDKFIQCGRVKFLKEKTRNDFNNLKEM